MPLGARVSSSGAVSQAKTIVGTRHLPACAKTLVARLSEMPTTAFATVFEVAGAAIGELLRNIKPGGVVVGLTIDSVGGRAALADGAAAAQFDAALAANPKLIVVDTRRRTEWIGGHVTGARHVPLHDLLARMDEIATWSKAAAHAGEDPVVWIYCGSGFRASSAASLLERAGIPVVHVDQDVAAARTRRRPGPAPRSAPGT